MSVFLVVYCSLSYSRFCLLLPFSSVTSCTSSGVCAHLCPMLMWAQPHSVSVCHPVYPCPLCSPSLWGLQQPTAMCDNGDSEDKPPAPPVRMSSTIFSTGSGKDSLSANHSSKPLPSVPEERKPRNKIISIFSGAEKGVAKTMKCSTTSIGPWNLKHF